MDPDQSGFDKKSGIGLAVRTLPYPFLSPAARFTKNNDRLTCRNPASSASARFSLNFPAGNDERGFGIEECAARFEEKGDLPEQFCRVRDLMDDKDGERGIECPVQVSREADGVWSALVGRDPGQEAFRLQFPLQDFEHLLL